MAKFLRPLIPLLAALALVPLLPAQTEPVPLVSLKFNVFSQSPITDLAYQPHPDAALTPLQFFSTTRSPEYTYKGDATVKFYDAGNPDPKAAPIATWDSAGMQNAFLLFFPNSGPAADGARYTALAVDDSLDKIPLRHFAILNVSGSEYEGRCGTRKFTIATGYNPPIEGSGRVYLELSATHNGRHMVVGGHQFNLGGNERAMVVIFPPAKKTGLQPIIRNLTDTPVIEEKPPAKSKATAH